MSEPSRISRRQVGSVCRLVTLAFLIPPLVSAAEPRLVPHNQDRPPNAIKSPEEAATSMTVPAGFRVEVAASEPQIVNPVAMTFDEKGRVWITESLEYPRKIAGPGRDRVKVLEDTDGDGRFEKVTIFAEGLNIPSGIAVGHGGLWVANSPDILFLQDSNGDGKADKTEVVVTGFGRDDTHELPNSLTWGPDGWLYGWNGVFNGSRVVSKNGKTYEFTCAMFRIHPKSREFELFCEGTSNPWGIAIDPEGSFFSSACVIDHLWHLSETGSYVRQAGPYPPHTWPMGSIVSYKHQKAAYCGIHYFDSPAYPAEYRGKLYMGNIHANGINVDRIKRLGSTYQAEPEDDFLLANDSWFMPVSQKTGPDGSLYILDWYDRYHCYQDANRDPNGIDRLHGRLYRIRYKDTPRRANFDLATWDDPSLIGLLASENVYDRETAQRLLTERQVGKANATTRKKLEVLVLDDRSSKKERMHALWVLTGSGPLDLAFHDSLLKHSDATLRAWGVRIAGSQAKTKLTTDSSAGRAAAALSDDPSPDVRLQAAIAARKFLGEEGCGRLLLDILLRSGDDRLIPHIVWQNLNTLPEKQFGAIISRIKGADIRTNLAVAAIVPRAIDRLLSSPSPDARLVASILRTVIESTQRVAIRDSVDRLANHLREEGSRQGKDSPLGRAIVDSLAPSLSGDRSNDPSRNDLLVLMAYCGSEDGLKGAKSIIKDPLAEDSTRALAFEAICFNEQYDSVGPLVEWVLVDPAASLSSDAQSRMIASLGLRREPEVAATILKVYPRLAPEQRSGAIVLLSQRIEWSKALIAAVLSRSISRQDVSLNQVRKFQTSKDPEIVSQARSVWGTVREQRNPQREQVVRHMRGLLASTPGDPLAGEAVFKRICAQCHKIHGVGQEVGPDLTSNGRNDFNQLVSNVFDPSQVIGDAYESTTIATDDGRVLTGLLLEEGSDRIQLKLPGGKIESIPRGRLDQMKTISVSLMPEGLENQMAPQEIADLFAFLSYDKHPSDRAAKTLPGSGPIGRRESVKRLGK